MVYYLRRIDERSCLMVQENGQQTVLQEPLLVILQRLCLRYGSTCEGRRESGYSSKGTDSFIRGISGYSVSNKSTAQSGMYLDQLPCRG